MTTRRDFLRQSALLGAGLTISPFFISAGRAGVSANDKIGVGLIGCNGQGFENLKAYLRVPEVECVALSDIDAGVLEKRAADTAKITGRKVGHLYKDWRALIDNKDIDIVIVGTPDHWHCLQMVAACEAGKDVFRPVRSRPVHFHGLVVPIDIILCIKHFRHHGIGIERNGPVV